MLAFFNPFKFQYILVNLVNRSAIALVKIISDGLNQNERIIIKVNYICVDKSWNNKIKLRKVKVICCLVYCYIKLDRVRLPKMITYKTYVHEGFDQYSTVTYFGLKEGTRRSP